MINCKEDDQKSGIWRCVKFDSVPNSSNRAFPPKRRVKTRKKKFLRLKNKIIMGKTSAIGVKKGLLHLFAVHFIVGVLLLFVVSFFLHGEHH